MAVGTTLPQPMDSRHTLLQLLHTHALKVGNVTLSSGKVSDWFVDCKQAVLRAEGHRAVGQAIWHAMEQTFARPDAVAGVALGGCSLASATAMISLEHGAAVDAVYVRKESKGHGSDRRVEGHSHLPAGASVVVLEDVVTTGASTLRAIEVLRGAGLHVCGVVAIVDRGEGAQQAFDARDLPWTSLFSRADFVQPNDPNPTTETP